MESHNQPKKEDKREGEGGEVQSLGTLGQLWLNNNYFSGPREGFMNTNSNDSIVHTQVSNSLKSDITLKNFSEYSSSKTFSIKTKCYH